MLGYINVPDVSSHGIQPAPHGSAQQSAPDRVPRILIADDDPTNRRVLQGMLAQLGYTSVSVEDGEQAVRALEDGHFDAVLMDCLMPVLDGYDATRAIRSRESADARSRHPRLPVIAVTALAMHGARDRCLDAGMDDYLTKPVMLESLQSVLDRWINQDVPAAAWNACPDAPAQAADEPIDGTMLDELRALGDDVGPTLIAELVHDFGVEIPARFPEMHTAVARQDIPSLLRELHFVAGCAAIVGARHVERIARSVDATNAPSSPDQAALLVRRLEVAFTTAHGLLTSMALPRSA